MVNDLYRSLGLTPSASIDEIKKAYRQLAKEYHPDKNKDGAEKFKEISNAYSILIDPEKKREYISKSSTYEESSEPRGFSAHGFTSAFFTSNPFEHFFNSYRAHEPPPEKKAPVDYDIRTTYKVSLEHIYNGSAIKVNYKEARECPTCHGNPKQSTLKRSDKCKHCDGTGYSTRTNGRKSSVYSRCPFCQGKGVKNFYAVCGDCQNEPFVNKKVTLKVPKGIRDGHSLQLKNRGNLKPDKTRGSLLIRVIEEQHPLFTRQGDNLYINVTISLKEAIMGFKNKVLCAHLDGRLLTATQPTGTVIKPGSKRVITGEGMPITNSTDGAHGDLLVTFSVEFPDIVQVPKTREAKLAIDALFETEQEIEARENAIVIDDEDDKKEATPESYGASSEETHSDNPPITIPDDDNEMEDTQATVSELAEDIPQEFFDISDDEDEYEQQKNTANQANNLGEISDDDYFSDEDGFPHLFNAYI